MKLSTEQFKHDFEERLTSKFAIELAKAGAQEKYGALSSMVKNYYSTIKMRVIKSKPIISLLSFCPEKCLSLIS